MLSLHREQFLQPGRYGAPPLRGAIYAFCAIAVATLAIYPLKHLAPVSSLSIVYLPVVAAVATLWGFGAALVAIALSALEFNVFHLPPVGHFTIASSHNLAALLAFAVIALLVTSIGNLARTRSLEADRRRAEADVAAAAAQQLLSTTDTTAALPTIARQLALALDLRSASLTMTTPSTASAASTASPRTARPGHATLPLDAPDAGTVATLEVPAESSDEVLERLSERVLPTLAALLSLAARRDELLIETVHTEALRHSDEVKTALLRAVSHDLRTPLTAIVAAGHALGSDSLDDDERHELAASVVSEGSRLADLVQKLLDLSRLQAGRAEPHREWVAIEELVVAARDGLGLAPERVSILVPDELPEIRADGAQLERVFTNLLQNADRYAPDTPIAVHATQSDKSLRISVTDQGRGISKTELQRIFEPFYRGPGATPGRGTGSGLGLSIARGFTEANGGTLTADSLPDQGTTFTVELPL